MNEAITEQIRANITVMIEALTAPVDDRPALVTLGTETLNRLVIDVGRGALGAGEVLAYALRQAAMAVIELANAKGTGSQGGVATHRSG